MDDEIDRLLRDHAERWRDAQPEVHLARMTGGAARFRASRQGQRHRAVVAMAVTGCVVLLLAGVVLARRRAHVTPPTELATAPTAPSTTRPVTPTTSPLPTGVELSAGASVIMNLPSNSGIQAMAVDPDAPGVWAWGTGSEMVSANGIAGFSRIWHYDPATEALRSWTLGTSGDVMAGVSFPALAACSTGVWFGSNHLLLHLDPATGAQHRYTVPPVSSAAADASRPEYLRGLSGVMALSCDDHDGSVLVGLSDSTTAFRFHPSDGEFDPITLPADAEVTMLAASTDGDVAIGLQSVTGAGPHRVLVVPHDGAASRIVAVQDSAVVVADGDRFVVGSGAQIIDAGATSASDPLIPDSVVGKLDPSTTVPWPLTGGRFMIVGRPDGGRSQDASVPRVVERRSTDSGGVTSHEVELGTMYCSHALLMVPYGPEGPSDGSGDPHVTTTTLAPDARCPVGLDAGARAMGVVVDRSGDLYGIVDLNGPEPSFQVSLIRVHLP